MRRFALLASIALAVVALAGSPRTWSTTSGVSPQSLTAGVSLNEATAIRVFVVGTGGTITGGRVCAFYLPPGATLVSQWRHNGNLDMSLSTNGSPDAGAESAQQLPDLDVGGKYGRVAFVNCGITGTASTITVTTESWGPTFP